MMWRRSARIRSPSAAIQTRPTSGRLCAASRAAELDGRRRRATANLLSLKTRRHLCMSDVWAVLSAPRVSISAERASERFLSCVAAAAAQHKSTRAQEHNSTRAQEHNTLGVDCNCDRTTFVAARQTGNKQWPSWLLSPTLMLNQASSLPVERPKQMPAKLLLSATLLRR